MIRGTSILLIVIIAALSIALLHTYDYAKRVEYNLVAQKDTVKIWRDRYGHSNAELQVSQLDYRQLSDSFRHQLKIKPKTITRVATVTSTTTDTVYIVTGRPVVNRWSSFNLLDNNTLAYTVRDSLALVTYKKKYGFMNLDTKYVTRAVSFNPQSIITGMTTSEIIPEKRRVGLGLYAGYGITLSGGVVRAGWSTGVGLCYNLF